MTLSLAATQLDIRQQHVAGCSTTAAISSPFLHFTCCRWSLICVLLVPLQYDSIDERLSQALSLADVAGTKARLASLQNDASSDSIWDDPERAQGLLSEISSLKDELAEIDRCGWGCGGCRRLQWWWLCHHNPAQCLSWIAVGRAIMIASRFVS
jgi:hypothetical protein